jgi:hypothetical protein
LDTLKDKMQIQLQQLVTASFGTMQERESERMRAVERELVFLKLGQSAAQRKETDCVVNEAIHFTSTGGGQSGSDDLAEGLSSLPAQFVSASTPLSLSQSMSLHAPSETIWKALIAQEIFTESLKLEDRLRERLMEKVESEVSTLRDTVTSKLQKQVLAACVDTVLYSTSVPMSVGTINSNTNTNNSGFEATNIMKLSSGTSSSSSLIQQQQRSAVNNYNNHKNNNNNNTSVNNEDDESEEFRRDFEKRVAAGKRSV